MENETKKTAYINYKSFAINYDYDNNSFSVYHTPEGKIIDHAELLGAWNPKTGEKKFDFSNYESVNVSSSRKSDSKKLCITYKGKNEDWNLSVEFTVSSKGLVVEACCRSDLDYRFNIPVLWGEDPENDTFAMSLDRNGIDLRSALGPAASSIDNVLFDRKTDNALVFSDYHKLKLSFDYKRHIYVANVSTGGSDGFKGFSLNIKNNLYEDKFHIHYKPKIKNTTFKTPPCGWMTWYAVGFDTGEKTIFENAEIQKKELAKYGANTIWVDWEWYHPSREWKFTEEINFFSENKNMFPHGMKYTADKIKEMGFIPAIWIGITNEPTENEFIRKNPDAVAFYKKSWCGSYFFDPTNPKYLNEYLPDVVAKIKEWGYQAIKWDCLPITLDYYDDFHNTWANEEISTEDGLRNVIEKVRELLGEDYYMLSCGGGNTRVVTLATDLFDAARIGGDVFKWSDFMAECVRKLFEYYQYHSVTLLTDPDNLIVREEFNNFNQAVSRVSLISVLGLPVTLGDDLTTLPYSRMELIKRALPALNIHPMDIRETAFQDNIPLIVNLSICKEYGEWNVVDLFNVTDEEKNLHINLNADLHLDDGEYYAYDYWNKKYLGKFNTSLNISLSPFESKVLSLKRESDIPTVISTSRHITQGGFDLIDLKWDDEKKILSGISDVVDGEEYRIVFSSGRENSPRNSEAINLKDNVWEISLYPEKCANIEWKIEF